MKFIKTRNEFLNEAVRVETNRYERSHGKKPRGYGQWAFYFDDKGGEPIFTPKAMSYSDAVKWAKGEAKKAGKEYIYVGESLNEGVKGYSPAERMEMAKKGLALDDGSFPIRNLNDLKNAIMAYGRAKDQAKAAKFIAKRAKALNAEDLIPDTEDFQKSLKESVVTEATNMNDPVLMAFRAAKMKREKELAKPKRRPLYGKERMKAEDDLWQISQDLKDLYADRGQLLIDMEQEAEAEGGPIADEYGGKLNDIEDQIQKLLVKRSKLEIRLAESFEQHITEKKHKSSGSTYLPDYYDSIEKHFTDDRRKNLEDAGIKVTSDPDRKTKIKVEWSTEDQAKVLRKEIQYLLNKVFNAGRAKNLLRDYDYKLLK
jgi:hypothetical protein